MKIHSYRVKRLIVRLLVVILFFAIPFISIGDSPLMRFDISHTTIYFAGGEVYVDQIFSILLFLFSLAFFFFFFTLVFGRVWCGWFCPQTVLLEFIPKSNNKVIKAVVAVFVSFIVTVGLILYTIPPERFFSMLLAGEIFPLWWVLTFVIAVDLIFIGRVFCKSVCPYAMLQSLMVDDDTLRIGLHPERADSCIKCLKCVRVCPTGIDIREGLNYKCVSCARCVDACGDVMKKMNHITLVDYYFGGLKFKLFTPNRIVLFLVATFFMVVALVSFNSGKGVTFKVIEKSHNSISLEINNRMGKDVLVSFSSVDLQLQGENAYTIGKDGANVTIAYTGEHRRGAVINATVVNGRKETERRIRVF